MIEIQGLKKAFGDKVVLNGISIRIEDGDIFGLVGVSGAGKSTLLRCINGLETYDEGSLRVNRVEVKDLDKAQMRQYRSKIGMVFQQFSLLERKTVYENISFPMQCFKYSKAETGKRVHELLELVGLSEKRDVLPRYLSGGQKQRVAIARALTMNPTVLLCDEATSALDPNITSAILDLLKRINTELGLTIVVVTHQMSVMKKVCTNMAVLRNGRLTATGSVLDIFLKRPEQLADFLGESAEYQPETGKTIFEILHQGDDDRSLISRIAIETGVAFDVVWGALNKYQDAIAGSFTISVDAACAQKIENYLTAKHIEWRGAIDVQI
jgi:D-methionine transport system ATP-binding protein